MSTYRHLLIITKNMWMSLSGSGLLAEAFVINLADQLPHCAAVDWLRQQVALHILAIHPGELQYLVACLHAFGHHIHPQVPRERQNCPDDLGILWQIDPGNKRAIYLQSVNRKPMEVTQRGITRSKIIERQPNSESLDPPEGHCRGIDVLNDRALGNLNLQAARVKTSLAANLGNPIDQIGLRELLAGKVDAHTERRIG